MKKYFSMFLLVGVMLLVPIVFTFAEQKGGASGSSGSKITNPIGSDSMDINTLIAELLKVVAMIGGIVCVFFIIYAGFLFVKAQGNPEEISKAKTTLLWSIIGAAVLLGASVIAEVIKGTVEGVTNIQLPR